MLNRTYLKYFATLFFLAGAISMLVMSMHYFQKEVTGVMMGKPVTDQWWYGLSLRGHILFGILAIFLGPFQFIETFRQRYLNTHRKLGYVYAFCVLLSGICGLIVAQYPMGGIISQIGFSLLAIFWLISLYLSITSIRNKNLATHRKWMFVNYGLTFAAIPQRTLLLVPLFINVEFMDIYRLSAWLPWILNTLITLSIHNRLVRKGVYK